MAGSNPSMDASGNSELSGGTPPPPQPQSVDRDNHCPVPLWEREFCSQACNITWEAFCEKKRCTPFFRNIMDWDDSGAFENFKFAKERFRANYRGKLSEDPLLDPDMHKDEVGHSCKVDPELVADPDNVLLPFGLDDNSIVGTGLGGQANLTPTGLGEPANVTPTGWGEPANVTPMGQGEPANPTPEAGAAGQADPTPEAGLGGKANLLPVRVWGAQANVTPVSEAHTNLPSVSGAQANLPTVKIWGAQTSSNRGSSNKQRKGGSSVGGQPKQRSLGFRR